MLKRNLEFEEKMGLISRKFATDNNLVLDSVFEVVCGEEKE